MHGHASPKTVVACTILEYLTKNRKPFSFGDLIDELIENGTIDEEDRITAHDVLDKYYNEGTLVPMIMPETTELVLVFQFEPDDEILHYLKENGGREDIKKILDKMYFERGLNHYEVKSAIMDLMIDKTLSYDQVTDEVYIPTTT